MAIISQGVFVLVVHDAEQRRPGDGGYASAPPPRLTPDVRLRALCCLTNQKAIKWRGACRQ